ncbi:MULTISPECIES: hypothetical protein [unclassified Streptomyces]|uniref:hypothetical protein n=1 Tax=unclassified Streptomyces TaxID=2593676 RepID=UPI0035DCD005
MDDYERRAASHRLHAAKHRLIAGMHDAGAALAGLAKALHDADAHITATVAREVAEHPDLAELNVQLDGFYGEDHRWTT